MIQAGQTPKFVIFLKLWFRLDFYSFTLTCTILALTKLKKGWIFLYSKFGCDKRQALIQAVRAVMKCGLGHLDVKIG